MVQLEIMFTLLSTNYGKYVLNPTTPMIDEQ